MKTKIKIHFLVAVILVTTIFKTWAQDGGYLPDLPGFPSGTYAQVAAVGVKIQATSAQRRCIRRPETASGSFG